MKKEMESGQLLCWRRSLPRAFKRRMYLRTVTDDRLGIERFNDLDEIEVGINDVFVFIREEARPGLDVKIVMTQSGAQAMIYSNNLVRLTRAHKAEKRPAPPPVHFP